MENENIINQIKEYVSAHMDMTRELEDEELWELIDDAIQLQASKELISIAQRDRMRLQIFNSFRRMDVIQELIDDSDITEIMVNGPDNIFIEKEGRIQRWEGHFESEDRLFDIACQMASRANRIVNESVPIADTRLKNGSRVNIVLPPVALNGPVITIRKFYETPFTMEKMIEKGSISEEAAGFLSTACKAGYNIFVSGGTGSGKTTFLNALSDYIPKEERVITIEDSAELRINRVENLVRLETRTPNIEGDNAITIRDLIKTSLRMRPDRIIVGEVRGPEAIDMIQGMNTGHSSMSTGHANSPADMLARLETMVLMGMDIPLMAVRGQIASAVDIIVYLGRMRDRTRKVLAVNEVCGYSTTGYKLNTLYEYDMHKNILTPKNELKNKMKMEMSIYAG